MTSTTPDPAEIARLKAEAAQAAADAAAAKAAAAQAALEAALAAEASSAQPAPTPETSAQPPAQDAASTELPDYAIRVRDGYDFAGPVLPVGTYLDYS
ncbi:ATPase, partial [Actinomyces sp. MRS3W]|nr:ATPase [Actinomyces sp. MRS3W]